MSYILGQLLLVGTESLVECFMGIPELLKIILISPRLQAGFMSVPAPCVSVRKLLLPKSMVVTNLQFVSSWNIDKQNVSEKMGAVYSEWAVAGTSALPVS